MSRFQPPAELAISREQVAMAFEVFQPRQRFIAEPHRVLVRPEILLCLP